MRDITFTRYKQWFTVSLVMASLELLFLGVAAKNNQKKFSLFYLI